MLAENDFDVIRKRTALHFVSLLRQPLRCMLAPYPPAIAGFCQHASFLMRTWTWHYSNLFQNLMIYVMLSSIPPSPRPRLRDLPHRAAGLGATPSPPSQILYNARCSALSEQYLNEEEDYNECEGLKRFYIHRGTI